MDGDQRMDALTTRRVYIAPGCLDADACGRIRAAMDAARAESAEILDDAVIDESDARRASSLDVDRHTLEFVERILDSHRDTIAKFFTTSLTAREGAGFMRYQPGDYYRPHRDRARVSSWPAAARRRVAVVVFLNSSHDADADGGFSGGVLRLLDEPRADTVPREGVLVAFPAETLHEVTPVTAGTRDVIVDWFY